MTDMTPSSPAAADRLLSRLDGPWRQVATDIAEAGAALGIAVTLRAILSCLRDMPYRRPAGENSVAASLEQWRGTCSAKHLAVDDLLRRLGFAPKLWMARYVIRPDFPGLSAALRQALRETVVHDLHNYITCDLGEGPILIDVTFPRTLESFGFIVTREWTGHGNFRLACAPPVEVRDVAAPATLVRAKREWLATVNTGRAAELREQVIMGIATLMDRTGAPSDRRGSIRETLRSLGDDLRGRP